jgi:hypothetical protein
MRAALIPASLVAIAPLAACGEGSSFDNAFRESYRTKGIESCVASARATAPAGVDAAALQRICECTVERSMEGKSATELMSPPDPADQDRIIRQCLARIVPGAGAGAKPPA